MRKLFCIVIAILYTGCSYKASDFKPADKRDNILYDLSEESKIEKAKEMYGADWRNHL